MDDCCWVLIVLCSFCSWLMRFKLIMQKCCDWPLLLSIYSRVSLWELLTWGTTFFFCSFLMRSKKSIAKMTIGFREAGSGFCGGFGLFFQRREQHRLFDTLQLFVYHTRYQGSMEPAKRLMENSSLCAAYFANPEFSFMCSTSHACFIISLARNQVAKTCLHCIDKLCNIKTWKRNSYLERQIQHLMWEFP